MNAGPPRLLGGLSVLFGIAAGARSADQRATHFGDAPLACALSVLAAVALRAGRRTLLTAAASVALAGVLAIGALTLLLPVAALTFLRVSRAVPH